MGDREEGLVKHGGDGAHSRPRQARSVGTAAPLKFCVLGAVMAKPVTGPICRFDFKVNIAHNYKTIKFKFKHSEKTKTMWKKGQECVWSWWQDHGQGLICMTLKLRNL